MAGLTDDEVRMYVNDEVRVELYAIDAKLDAAVQTKEEELIRRNIPSGETRIEELARIYESELLPRADLFAKAYETVLKSHQVIPTQVQAHSLRQQASNLFKEEIQRLAALREAKIQLNPRQQDHFEKLSDSARKKLVGRVEGMIASIRGDAAKVDRPHYKTQLTNALIGFVFVAVLGGGVKLYYDNVQKKADERRKQQVEAENLRRQDIREAVTSVNAALQFYTNQVMAYMRKSREYYQARRTGAAASPPSTDSTYMGVAFINSVLSVADRTLRSLPDSNAHNARGAITSAVEPIQSAVNSVKAIGTNYPPSKWLSAVDRRNAEVMAQLGKLDRLRGRLDDAVK